MTDSIRQCLRLFLKLTPSVIIINLILACGGNDNSGQPIELANESEQNLGVDFEVLSTGHTIPWGIEVISENEFLFTERLGTLFHYNNGATQALAGIPETFTVTVAGLTYGGLMDVSLHPQFTSNSLVYISYVGRNSRMSVARFKFENNQVSELQTIFNSNAFSIGSRIAWQDDSHFFVSQGLGGNPFPEPGAQDIANHGGKIHRLTDTGNIPTDNPIFDGYTQPTSIWSYGHRDPQGLFFDQQTQTLYSNEHGPLGGDELNIIERGGNYGWPLFSYGLNYDRSPVSNLTEEQAAMTTILPIKYWDESFNIAPSSLVKLETSNFEEWNDYFLIGSLAKRQLIGYNLETDETDILLSNTGRLRDIAQLPSGDILILIDRGSPHADYQGRILKLMAN